MCWLKYVILATFGWILTSSGNIIRNEDICGPHNGRRLYLELGERGILYAKNVTFVRSWTEQQLPPRPYTTSITSTTNSSHYQCSLELVTCPSCVVVVVFKNIALSHHCGDGGVVMDSPCRCDYVWLSEPPYEDVSGSPFCGTYAPITYRSSTRTLSINLFYSQFHKHAFTIEYTAERNRMHLKGTEMTSKVPTKELNGTGGGILTSPFFPARYPRDLGLEYIITCPKEAPCRIRLLFSDFQLATVSIMEFYDWNGQRLDVSSGARFRPPVIVSSGPSLLIRFYANGGSGLGYKAFYSFVIGHTYDKSVWPVTDCGGYVENLGGTITMMNMVDHGVKTYDCVWLIRPPKNFLHMKTHMYLKVVGFADMAGNTELIIKQGPTSALMSLEVIRHPASQLQPLRHREHIAPVTSGFHVSFRGTFGPSSYLAIAYGAFSYRDCFAGTDFLCQNHRCIPTQLNCDGFDHCGDNSDEPATCFQDWEMEPHDRKWHMNKANYYFPKIDRYPDLKTATLVFVASSLGLIILISALIILLYRIGARARQQRELQSRLETISELLDGARIDEISIPPDDPPGYEAPPGYEEVAKLALPKKPRCLNRDSCGRSSRRRQRDEDENSSTYFVVEGANNNCSSQTTPLVPSTSRVPESPPPPYVTPPGTILRNLNLAGLSASMRQICPVRHSWLRCSSHYPQQSLSNNDHPFVAGSSTNTEALGTYNTDCANSNATWISDSSPKDMQIVREAIQACAREMLEETSQHAQRVSTENYDEAADRANKSDEKNSVCSCEGACGCAINTSNVEDVSIGGPETSETSASSSSVNNREATPKLEPEQTANIITDKTDEYQEQDSSTARTVILKLLSSKMKPSYHSADSTAMSSPCDTMRRSSRNFSHDSCTTRISTISTCNSYEKLQDEFEIVSDVASSVGCATNPSTIANTPSNTPKNVIGRRRPCNDQQYPTCDLDSLYEGIKILDTYLARRSINVDHKRRSVTVMLFGTPEHGLTRDRLSHPPTRRRRLHARIWHSSEDALNIARDQSI
ncbi:uncharacterized protein LOC109863691 isoform X2 [Pseudomyrmex gracilis]|uniref:uncharacterized protein LOC109863691 isoform X2 n=1 Tax=Pseudomyrmex gracilis TaxID=219809 RepID=UPI000995848C|nr:uncharacterized protein LOC109863691 isoform X2 [Pseudomyrmex gracilis]